MQGFVYPLTISNGGLMTTDQYAKLVSGAIMSSCQTHWEERVWRPEYGQGVYEFQSVSNLVDILRELREAISIGLDGYLDVVFEVYGSISEDGVIAVEVLYTCPDGLERTLEITL